MGGGHFWRFLLYDTSFERSQIARKRRSEQEEEVATRKSRTITYALSCVTCKSRTITYALSRFTRKSCTSYAQVASSALVAYAQKPCYTYALSCFTRTDVHRTHKSPRSHKSYTYAISCLRAKVVLYVRNKLLYAQKLYILRKVAYRAHKPYILRTQLLQVISTNKQGLKK